MKRGLENRGRRMKFHSPNEIRSLITHRYFFARRIAGETILSLIRREDTLSTASQLFVRLVSLKDLPSLGFSSTKKNVTLYSIVKRVTRYCLKEMRIKWYTYNWNLKYFIKKIFLSSCDYIILNRSRNILQ